MAGDGRIAVENAMDRMRLVIGIAKATLKNFVWRNQFCAVGAEYIRLARRADRLRNASFGKPFQEGRVSNDLLIRPLPPLEETGRY